MQKAIIASIDADTEKVNLETDEKLRGTKIIMVIARRLLTIHNADIIMLVSHGRACEKETHKEIMNVKGIYRGLYVNDVEAESKIFKPRLRKITTLIMSVIVYFISMIIMNYRLVFVSKLASDFRFFDPGVILIFKIFSKN